MVRWGASGSRRGGSGAPRPGADLTGPGAGGPAPAGGGGGGAMWSQGRCRLLAGQGNLGVAGEPGALVVPAGAGLVAAFPVEPAGRAAASAARGGQGGEQVLDLRDGQRNHARVGGRRLIGC